MHDYHTPVLLEECLQAMEIRPDGCYVDLTFGGGGHSRAILEALGPGGRLYSVDQDPDALANALESERFTLVASNFRHIDRFMDYYGELGQVDAVLADLGVSSHHLDTPERGFSFRYDEPLLDMRMNTRGGKSSREVLATYSAEELARVFYEYGELKQSRQIARSICAHREGASIDTVGQLLAVVKPHIKPQEEKKQLGMLFQALRIEVNNEMAVLEQMLQACQRILRPGGRLVVITYHSLEDRLVKNFLRSSSTLEHTAEIYGSAPSAWEAITRKPLVPSTAEIERNPRARSAKLRIAALKD